MVTRVHAGSSPSPATPDRRGRAIAARCARPTSLGRSHTPPTAIRVAELTTDAIRHHGYEPGRDRVRRDVEALPRAQLNVAEEGVPYPSPHAHVSLQR